jgi:hypothetical protein
MNGDVKLKYQDLINEQKTDDECPCSNCFPATGEAFRWVLNPIEHPWNFLPNKLYSEHQSRPIRINSEVDLHKCSDCALSMFTSEDKARKKFQGIPSPMRETLGYTHLAHGDIENAGLRSKAKAGHFNLFEYEGIELRSKFVIVDELMS